MKEHSPQMKRIIYGVVALAAVFGVRAAAQQGYLPAMQAGNPFAKPEAGRYRLLSEQGLVQPDGRQFIQGVKMWTIVDRETGSCFLMVFTTSGSTTSPVVCGESERLFLSAKY